jgi:hypothetical protein
MNKLQVKEHLRNGALYQDVTEFSLNQEWKRRLIRQYTLNNQLNAALQERDGFLKPLIYIGVPATCLLAVFAAYIGFIQPEQWLEKIVSFANFDIPPIGLKEIFIFSAVVDCLTLLIWKRESWL